MTDDDKTENTPDKTRRRRPRAGWIAMGIAGLLVAAIAGTACSVASGAKRDGHESGWFAERKIDRMLDEVEASDDQRSQIHDIVKAAVADMQEDRDLKKGIRQDMIEALAQETVDREALEALRQNKLAATDRASQRMLAALADAAEVLTPAQRQELAAEIESHWRHHRKHHRRHD